MRYILFLFLLPLTLFGQSQKISDMTSATTLSGTELVPIVQTTNKKATVSLLRGFGSYGTAGQYMTVNGTANGFTFVTPPFISAYPGAGIAVSTGSAWGTSITDNSANWNTAFGWGNHASAGYLSSLTNGSGTTASGSAVDLGGTLTGDATIDGSFNTYDVYFNNLDITGFQTTSYRSSTDDASTYRVGGLGENFELGSAFDQYVGRASFRNGFNTRLNNVHYHKGYNGSTYNYIIYGAGTQQDDSEGFNPEFRIYSKASNSATSTVLNGLEEIDEIFSVNRTGGIRITEPGTASTGHELLLRSTGAAAAQVITKLGIGSGLSISGGNLVSSGGWGLTGNSGTVDGTNFLGTTDNIPFNIRVNNQKSGRIDHINSNNFYGYQAGNVIGIGANNNAFGHQAMLKTTTGSGNTAFGTTALSENISGNANTAIGSGSLLNSTNTANTAVGASSLQANISGGSNVAVGNNALQTNTTGSNNTGIGYTADVGSNNLTNATAIGNGAVVNSSNTIQLGNASVTAVNIGTSTTAKLISGQLQITGGTLSSGYVLTSDGSGNATWQAASGGGNVTKVGTPVDNQIGVWTGDGTIEGDTKFTWDGSLFTIGGGSLGFQQKFNYGSADGGDITGQMASVDQLSFGFNNGAAFAGSAGVNSGRTVYFYDRIDSKYMGGFSSAGFTVGESPTRYGLNVVRPNASVTGLNILATGQAQLGEYTATSSFTGTPVGYLQFDASGNILTSALPSGGGYTNLTSFVDQTPWRLFYSNTSGDVTELAFGASNTYLKSNGVSAAPTFEVISVPDGSYGAISVASSGTVWDINAATVGITQLSASGTPSASTYLRGDNTWATVSGSGLTYAQVKAMKFK